MTTTPETNIGETQAQRLERVYDQIEALLHQPEVAQRLGATADAAQTPFTALSAATFADGVYFHVPANTD